MVAKQVTLCLAGQWAAGIYPARRGVEYYQECVDLKNRYWNNNNYDNKQLRISAAT